MLKSRLMSLYRSWIHMGGKQVRLSLPNCSWSIDLESWPVVFGRLTPSIRSCWSMATKDARLTFLACLCFLFGASLVSHRSFCIVARNESVCRRFPASDIVVFIFRVILARSVLAVMNGDIFGCVVLPVMALKWW